MSSLNKTATSYQNFGAMWIFISGDIHNKTHFIIPEGDYIWVQLFSFTRPSTLISLTLGNMDVQTLPESATKKVATFQWQFVKDNADILKCFHTKHRWWSKTMVKGRFKTISPVTLFPLFFFRNCRNICCYLISCSYVGSSFGRRLDKATLSNTIVI